MQWFIDKLALIALPISKQWQARSKLRDLRLWKSGINSAGHIAIDGIDTLDLVKEFGTPLFVVNRNKLIEDALNIKSALSLVVPTNSKVLYSYKTNCIPGILKELHLMDIGAEVVSPYELWLAETLGVPGEMIVYNGVNKTEESIERAVKLDILAVNIDHFEEIDRIYRVAQRLNKTIRVGIRLGLTSNSQFGFSIETGEALRACDRIISLSNHLEMVCIHFNLTSNSRSSSEHSKYAVRAIEFMAEVQKRTKRSIPYLDIGGGFGVPTSKNMSAKEYALYRMIGLLPKPPSPNDFENIDRFISNIIEAIRKYCVLKDIKMPIILIEPGRYITSRAELLLTSVLAVKRKANGKRYVITDAGRLSVAFPTDFEYHEVFLANRPTEPLTTLYHIMGRICTSADWLFKNRLLPEIFPGDVLAIMDAGAYFSSYSTNFSFPRPPIVMVSKGKVEIIRQGETFEYLTSMYRV